MSGVARKLSDGAPPASAPAMIPAIAALASPESISFITGRLCTQFIGALAQAAPTTVGDEDELEADTNAALQGH